MLAIASREIPPVAGGALEASPSGPARPRSTVSVIGHGILVGAAATVVQVLSLVGLLYVCGIIAT